MRDILEDLFGNEPLDPVEAARRNMRPNLRKRFYPARRRAGGRRIRSCSTGAPSRRRRAARWRRRSRALGAGDRGRMGSARRAHRSRHHAADALRQYDHRQRRAERPSRSPQEIAKYLGSDLLCYRADTPDGLVRTQAQHWDPILAWARDALGARFMLGEGVMFVAQPEGAVAAARGAIPSDPWRLGAASVITTLTGSALIALAMADGQLGLDAAWNAANVDEDWNMDFWGRDELALQRRAVRFADMQAAAKVLALTSAS